jgi:hypothetical protein
MRARCDLTWVAKAACEDRHFFFEHDFKLRLDLTSEAHGPIVTRWPPNRGEEDIDAEGAIDEATDLLEPSCASIETS